MTLRLAHRGDWRAAPENSLAAMQAAIELPGCDGLEFDVRSSFDSVAVLLHDETLARVQRVPLACSTLTAAQLAEHGVATLAEVLAAIGYDPFLEVELKELVQVAIDPLPLNHGRTDDGGNPELRNAVLSSFEVPILAWLRALRPTWPRWLNARELSDATIARAVELACAAISCEANGIDADGIDRARAAGMDVAAWTVRSTAEYERLAGLGVVAICAEAEALDA